MARTKPETAYAQSDRKNMVILGAFLLLAFAIGGGSRGDLFSHVLLRPVSFGIIAYALIHGAWDKADEVKPIWWLLLALATLMVAQLIPLPQSVWESLPGRKTIGQIGQLVGEKDIWRPLTLSPSRTLNSLMSLSVPVAAFSMLIILSPVARKRIFDLLIVIAVISIVIGVAQEMMGPDSWLYFYRVTNAGSAVGLFANRNHHAVFLAAIIPIVIYNFYARQMSVQSSLGSATYLAIIVLVVLMLPVIGSRAGLIIGLVAIALAFLISLYLSLQQRSTGKPVNRRAQLSAVWMLVGLVAVPLMIGIAVLAGRATAIERILANAPREQLRMQLTPYIAKMAELNLPFGTGFGTFELAFYQYEPNVSLGQPYMNQAHNDWLQIVAEGGLGGIAIVLAFLTISGQALSSTWRSRRRNWDYFGLRMSAFIGVLVLGMASVPDYPLRVPSIMICFIMLACLLVSSPGWVELPVSGHDLGKRQRQSIGREDQK